MKRVPRSERSTMRDVDVRRQLRLQLCLEHAGDPETLIIDELGVEQGSFRADIAVVNGMLQAYEIKSASDTLARLPAQIGAYGRVFDTVTLVVAPRHVESAVAQLPAWWGVIIADYQGEDLLLDEQRPARPNPAVDSASLVQLLWRDEALAVLEEHHLAGGLRRKPRRELWAVLVAGLPSDDLGVVVRDRLRARRSWRAEASPS
jgi:hypothetical protein